MLQLYDPLPLRSDPLLLLLGCLRKDVLPFLVVDAALDFAGQVLGLAKLVFALPGGAVLPLASASQGHTLAVVLFCLPSSSCGLASCGPPCLQLCTQDTHTLATHNKHTAGQRTFQSHAWQRNCQNWQNQFYFKKGIYPLRPLLVTLFPKV